MSNKLIIPRMLVLSIGYRLRNLRRLVRFCYSTFKGNKTGGHHDRERKRSIGSR